MLCRSALDFFIALSLLCKGHGMIQSDPTFKTDACVLDSQGESFLQQGGQRVKVRAQLLHSPSSAPYAHPRTQHVKSGLLSAPADIGSMSMQDVSAATKLMPMLASPKVLRSMYDNTTLFYHVHVPKTGGTTVANLLVSDICAPGADSMQLFTWADHCGKTCEMGLTDNELSCYNEHRLDYEHTKFNLSFQRAERLRVNSGAQKVVFVTSLRPGSFRLISQWAFETRFGLFVPPARVAAYSNESLKLYINGTGNGSGWIAKGNYLARNNLQVASLASVPWDEPTPVTREHLEKAKQVLMTGEWLIGFSKCMAKFHEKLIGYATWLHGGAKPKSLPAHVPEHAPIAFSPEVFAEVDAAAALDNELFSWAWSMAESSGDQRWAGTCPA
jgi:hypothetical protein